MGFTTFDVRSSIQGAGEKLNKEVRWVSDMTKYTPSQLELMNVGDYNQELIYCVNKVNDEVVRAERAKQDGNY